MEDMTQLIIKMSGNSEQNEDLIKQMNEKAEKRKVEAAEQAQK